MTKGNSNTMKHNTCGRIMACMLICACALVSLSTRSAYPQTAIPTGDDVNAKKTDSGQKSADNPSPGAGVKNEAGSRADLNEGRIGVLQSRNPLESGINARSITSRAFINYVQIDIAGGHFLPTGDLATGMDFGYFFGVNVRSPFTHLVLPSQLGESAQYFTNFDLGLHFSYITGESSERSTDTIAFAPLLLDTYYTLPFDTGKFKVYVYNGLGFSLASTVVVRNSTTVHSQSIAFTIRPAVGIEYFFSGRIYARMSAGYFICMESVVGMGVIASFGVGYLF